MTRTRKPLARQLGAVAAATGLLLLVPLVAMQFTGEVDWGVEDFVAAAVLLFTAGAAIVLALRTIEGRGKRVAAVAAIALALLLVWAELAVGVF